MNMRPSPASDDCFQIYLRIKPRLCATDPLQQQILKKLTQTRVQILSPYYIDCESRVFDYKQVFSGETDNYRLFERTMLVPINNVLNGFNSTVLIYGMTGAGKTHTMFGEGGDNGLVFQTLKRLFLLGEADIQNQTRVTMSFYEIYNENIRDLMKEGSANLHITEDPVKGVSISDLFERQIEHAEEARALVLDGIDRRAMNSTKTNDVSSRSHAILQLTVRRLITQPSGEPKLTESKLFLVDLAGNEKTFTNYTCLNKRFVEGVNINKSLLTLGKCINILAEQRRNQFVPFRDSKLTRILKESLGGNSKTVMIACVSPDRRHYEETLNTLKYSTVARGIRNKTTRNVRELRQDEWIQEPIGDVGTAEGARLEEIVEEIVTAAEEKARVEQILSNLIIAKSRNNQGSTSESVLQDMIFKIQYEKERAEEQIQTSRNSLLEYCRQSTNRSYTHQYEHATKKIAEYQKIIEQQKATIKKLKAQNQKKEATLSLRMDKENVTVVPALVNTQRVSSTRNTMYEKGKSLQMKRNNEFQWSMSNFTNLTKVNSKVEDEKSSTNNMNQTMPKRAPSQQKPRDLVIHLTSDKPSKESFLSQVRQIYPNLKDPRSQPAINQLLNQYQVHQYDLTSAEQSLVRKLKFFQEKPPPPPPLQQQQAFLRINSSEKNLTYKPQIRRSDSRKATTKPTFFK